MLIIRKFQPKDRKAVRGISGDTANLGQPVETFFSDREVLVGLLMDYYTDHEMESLWVAQVDGEVVGYLCGCLRHVRYQLLISFYIFPKVLLRSLLRGVFFQKETWQLMKAAGKTLLQGGYFKIIPEEYQAHLHINLRSAFRGREIGKQLMDRFFEQVRAAGLKGIYALTREDNKGACGFFEKMGFRALSRHVFFMPAPDGSLEGRSIVYGKLL